MSRNRSAVGHFRSATGEQAYVAAYRRAMTLLPTPRSTLDLETTFGRVRVYEFGAASADRAAIPIVLLPGRTSGVPMWAYNLPDLAAARTTYALDALGDAGLSVQIRRIRDAADQADWLDQVLAAVACSQRPSRRALLRRLAGGQLRRPTSRAGADAHPA